VSVVESEDSGSEEVVGNVPVVGKIGFRKCRELGFGNRGGCRNIGLRKSVGCRKRVG
jgi:hypothetical protein